MDRLYIVSTGILVVVGSLGVWAAHKTLKAIKDQTAEIGKSVEAIARQAGIMERQTSILEESVTAARISAEAAKKNAEFSQLNAEATKESAIAALRAAEIAEKSAIQGIEQTHLEQRAWVAPDVTMMADFTVGKPIKASIRLRNIGKTLALNLRTYQVLELSETPPTRFSMMGGSDPDITLFPGGDFWIHASTADSIISDDHMLKIRTGKQFLCAYGMIQYRDIFNPNDFHRTHFSFLYNWEREAFEACQGNNEVD